MATGGFKPNATTDFLEEWKAKREKMRAKMLGDIVAASGAPLATGNPHSSSRHAAPPAAADLPSGPDRSANCLPSFPAPRSLLRHRSEGGRATIPGAAAGGNPKKAPAQPDRAPSRVPPDPGSAAGHNTDKESPSPGKAKEKNSSGPSARKGKGQIEKRKLREKRRSTGVVSIPSNEVSPGGAPRAFVEPFAGVQSATTMYLSSECLLGRIISLHLDVQTENPAERDRGGVRGQLWCRVGS
ncbi:unnamed protein product [Tetraodon nigroviridis]|uniref:(spotted green pufferfish) hypothetical protein n=1 Tax=Tetraodon nigroviridis TaxID=99883 RepID=Q4S5E0_TETNG|nr:unnamed protein product [Tetraodon nigroviridis]